MIFVAFAELLLVGALIFVLREQIKAANERENKLRTELLSVLGKTETVALTLNDQRPAHDVRYVTDQDQEVTSRYGPA